MHRLALALILICVIFSCKKEEQQEPICYYNWHYEPALIGLIGFTSDELDTIIVSQYVANSSFGQLLSKDTITDLNVEMHHDTAYQNHYSPSSVDLKSGWDYVVHFPAAGISYSISNIAYRSRPEYYTRPPDGCNGNRHFSAYPDSIAIDGKIAYMSNYMPLYFLHR
jgi:hypothetical protein